MINKPCKHPCCPDAGPCKKAKDPSRIKRTAVIQRSALKQGVGIGGGKTGAKKRFAIKKISDRQVLQLRAYKKARKAFLLANPVCAVTGEPATEIHHMKGRIGKLLLDTRWWLPVSRAAHQKIELNPAWAKAQGYSVSRLNKQP